MKAKFKSIVSLLLTLTMLFSLAACGKKTENEGTQSANGNSTSEAKPEDAGNHPDYVYSTDFYTLDIPKSQYGITPLCYTEDGVYCSGFAPDDGNTAYQGKYDSLINIIYYVDYNGKVRELKGYRSAGGSEEIEAKPDFTSSSHVSGLFPQKDGSLAFVEEYYFSYYNGPVNEAASDPVSDPVIEVAPTPDVRGTASGAALSGINRNSEEYWNNLISGTKYYYRRIDTDGNELFTAELAIDENTYLNLYGMCDDGSGNLLIPADVKLLSVSPEGELKTVLEVPDYIRSVCRLSDGTILAQSGENANELKKLDLDTGSLGESYVTPANVYNVIAGPDYDYYYIDGSAFYGCNLSSDEPQRILDWLDCDIMTQQAYNAGMCSDGRVILVLSPFSGARDLDTQLAVISKKPWDSVPHKTTLTLGLVGGESYEFQQAAVRFNRTNELYRVSIIDYAGEQDYGEMCDPSSADFYEEGRKKFMTAVIAGEMPDLVSVRSLPCNQLAAKGLLEDLYPWLDNDEDYSRKDIIPSALAALESGGKLYSLCSGFSINTAYGLTSAVGTEAGWNYNQFNEALGNMPEGCIPFEWYTDRDMALRRALQLDMGWLVNWETGEVRFESEEFTQLLQFAAAFPTNDEVMAMNGPEDRDAFSHGMQLLREGYVNDPMFFCMDFAAPMAQGADISFVGYPSIGGSGSIVYMNSSCAMSAKSENKEGAWAFIKSLLNEENQNISWGIPVNRKFFDSKLSAAMTTQYETDGNGDYILDSNGEKVKKVLYSYFDENGNEVEVYEMTQAQADKYCRLIDQGGVVVNDNDPVVEIVMTESQAFFAGQKSAEEVAKLIQSKVNLYVNERR